MSTEPKTMKSYIDSEILEQIQAEAENTDPIQSNTPFIDLVKNEKPHEFGTNIATVLHSQATNEIEHIKSGQD